MKDTPYQPQQHGLTKTHRREYNSWLGARYRTTSPKHPKWRDYGGRGIKMCDRWRYSFAAFVEDMGRRPEGMELDRIDVNGHYEKANCRWVTRSVNVTSMRRSRRKPKRHHYLIAQNGVTADVYFWSEVRGISVEELHTRHLRMWSDERVLGYSLPAGWVEQSDGTTIKLSALAAEVGITVNALKSRLRLGQSMDDIRAGKPSPGRRSYSRNADVTLTALGRTQSLPAWVNELGLKRTIVRYRMNAGATDAQALGLAPFTSSERTAFNHKLAALNRQLKRDGGQGFTIVR